MSSSVGVASPWGAESDEEEQWDADEGGHESPPPLDPLQQFRDSEDRRWSGVRMKSVRMSQRRRCKQGWSVEKVTQRFLQMFLTVPDGVLDLRKVRTSLSPHVQRVNDITSILQSVQLVERRSTHLLKWIGGSPVSSFLSRNQQKLRREMENLQVVEETLDSLIRSCSQQLFIMTDDQESSPMAYVTLGDLSRLRVFQEQTMLVVKAPDETTLSVPAPSEERICVHLKGGAPIMVLTSDVSRGKSVSFITLEESRVTTTHLYTESQSPQSAVRRVTN